QADLRLPADGALADGDRRARVLGLGAPHVRERHVVLAARADDDHDAPDRDPDRDQDLQLARDDVGREVAPPNSDAVRARLPLDVRDRRALPPHAWARPYPPPP